MKRTIFAVVKSALSRNYSHSTKLVLTSPTLQLPTPASFPPPFAFESPRPPVSHAPSSAQVSPHAIQFPALKSDTIVFASSQSMYPRNLVSIPISLDRVPAYSASTRSSANLLRAASIEKPCRSIFSSSSSESEVYEIRKAS